jgi:molybdate transport system substrate-binding protein
MLRRLVILAALLGSLSLPVSAQVAEVAVFGASDLALAFKEIVPKFERALGVKVTLVLGSTGTLAKQIEHGAPADVFFAADRTFIEELAVKGVVIPETRALYAQGRLVLATARSAGAKLTELRQLTDARIRHVAIANPAHAPYGRAAEQALRAVGVWDPVRAKLVYGENIRQALQFVESGAAEAGLIALSLANVPAIDYVVIDRTLHAPLNQSVAVVRRSRRPELGLAFIQFVNGAEGRPIMKRFGFLLPGEF